MAQDRLQNLYRNIENIEILLSPKDLESPSQDLEKAILTKMFRIIRRMTERFKIGIVTALPAEFAAVVSMLDNVEQYPAIEGDPQKYYVGTIPSLSNKDKSKHYVIATQLAKMGNNTASSVASNLLRSFGNVEDVLMVGVAGGIPRPSERDKHVRLGDVVVSHNHGVLQYDMVKIQDGIIKIRDTSTPPSARMTNCVNLLEARRIAGEYPWERHIQRACRLEATTRPSEGTDIIYNSENQTKKIPHPRESTRRKGQPKIHYGLIGSANILLREPKIRDLLADKSNILAIEMEGSGIADGTWLHAANYILIRGICDYCDKQNKDLWKGYASVAAAAYARSLIETL